MNAQHGWRELAHRDTVRLNLPSRVMRDERQRASADSAADVTTAEGWTFSGQSSRPELIKYCLGKVVDLRLST